MIGRRRWSDWARCLGERHRFLTGRSNAPAMVLIRPLQLFHFLRERWLISSRRFFPQIHLAIQPILRQAMREWKSSLPVLSAAASLGSSPIPRQLAAFLTAVSPQSVQSESSLAHLRGEPQASRSGSETAAMVLPLKLVFHRLHQTRESTQIRRQSWILQESSQSLVRRVARAGQRIEVGIARVDSVMRQTISSTLRQPPPPVITQKEGLPRGITARDAGHVMEGARSNFGVNIDQLTDQVVRQIDQRVIAWCERMGRPN